MSYLGQAGQQNCLQSGSSKLIDIHCLNKFRLRVMENAPDICEPWACTHLFTCTHTYICIQRHNKNKLSKDMFQAVYLSRCWEHLWSTARQWLSGGRTVCNAVSLGPLLWSQFPVYLGPAGVLPGVGNWGSQGRTPLCSFTCHVGREWQSLAVGAGPSLVPSMC